MSAFATEVFFTQRQRALLNDIVGESQMKPLKSEAIQQDFVFITGRIVSDDYYVFIAHGADALEKRIYRTHLLSRDHGSWAELARFEWQAVDLAIDGAAPITALVLGRDGQVGVLAEGGKQEEHVDRSRAVGPMRGIDRLSDSVYAYGMKREVYRRLGSGRWERYNKGMQMSLAKGGKIDISAAIKQGLKEMGGINSIVDAPNGQLQAFGMRGEIWLLNKDSWSKIESPTNMMLTEGTTQEDGSIIVCGHIGVILLGQLDRWSVVEYSGPAKLDFEAISRFRGKTYLADGHSLRILVKDSLELVDFGVTGVIPCSSIVSGKGFLLSVAAKEIFVTSDGQRWQSLL